MVKLPGLFKTQKNPKIKLIKIKENASSYPFLELPHLIAYTQDFKK
jgi:hypothetical protein